MRRNIVITGYNGEDYDIVIPEYIDGIPVKEVQSLGIQSGIEAITIPDSVTVSEGALGLCFALSEITVSENHPELRLIDGVLFSKDRKTIICYPSELA